MRAAWYERPGAARDVLNVGETPAPAPGSGEVRVRAAAAGINPADVKRRAGAGGRAMTALRMIPGDDGAGVIDAVGPNVSPGRIGQRVWIYAATAGRPCGTSAEFVVVPAGQAVPLPHSVALEVGACLGVPALTAHRAVFADGPVAGRVLLVTGGAGAVGAYAIQLASQAGANVIATASTADKTEAARGAGAEHVVDYRRADAAESILAFAGEIDRIVDVALGANLPLSARVLRVGGTIAAYGSDTIPEPRLPFYPLMRRDVTIRLVSVFAMPEAARRQAIEQITALLEHNALSHNIARRHTLEDIAHAHEAVERGDLVGKVIITLGRKGADSRSDRDASLVRRRTGSRA